MLRRFGPAYWLSGLGLILGRLRLADHSAENIRQAAARGPVVYVLHTRSWMDWLALNQALNVRRLPLARFTNGLRTTWFRPVLESITEFVAAIRERLNHGRAPDPLASGWLAEAVSDGSTCCLFLVEPRSVGRVRPTRPARGADPVACLVEAQERCDRPVQVVPIVVVWARRPEGARTEVARFVLGSRDEPGPLQKLLDVLVRRGRGVVQAGRPVDLREMLERSQGEPQSRRVRRVRLLLRRFLYREAHIIRGPRIRPYRWTRRLVMNSPEVRDLIRAEAAATGRSEEEVREKASRTLTHIAARMSFPVVVLADLLCKLLFDRIFTDFDIRPDDAQRLREASRRGTLVLLPNHRSHLDYLLLSWLLYRQDIVIPHIVAGENLSFFPLGVFFRRLGAFFIRRSFRGDRIFPVVFARYLHQLIRDGVTVEFFIEGTRSRSGKVLPARVGVLGMVLDSAARGREDREVCLVPVGISYERVAEEATYANELSGNAKRPESVGGMLRARRVLRKRFGKVYLRVGEALTCREVFAAQPLPWADLSREQRNEALLSCGERIVHRISANLVLLPSGLVAAALLAQSRRGIRTDTIHARAERFARLAISAGAQPAHSGGASAAGISGAAIRGALERFERDRLIARLEDEGGEIIQVHAERRIALDSHKNGLLHFLAPFAMMATAVRACGDALTLEALNASFRLQVYLLRFEFHLDPDRPVEALADDAIAGLIRHGALLRDDERGLVAGPRELLAELAGLIRCLLESYQLVLRASRRLRSRDIPLSDLAKKVQEVGRALLAVDELKRPEALSLVNLKNAVRAYREEGVIQVRHGGAGLQFDEEVSRRYLDAFAAMLGS